MAPPFPAMVIHTTPEPTQPQAVIITLGFIQQEVYPYL